MMFGGFAHRYGTGDHRYGVDEVRGLVGGAAGFAVVAVLIFGVTAWTFTLNEAIG